MKAKAALAKLKPQQLIELFSGPTLVVGKIASGFAKGNLSPKDRKARSKAAEAGNAARQERMEYVGTLARLLSRSKAGVDHLLDVARGDHDPRVRVLALHALFIDPDGKIVEPQIPPKPTLEKIVAAFDVTKWNGKGGTDVEDLYRLGATAMFWLDAKRAYDRFAPLFSAKAIAKKETSIRAKAVLRGVPKRTEDDWPLPPFDKRWPALLAPLVRDKKLGYSVMFFLEALPPDPVVIEPLLARLGKTPAKVGYFDDTSIRLLGRVADARVVPYLVGALRSSWMHFSAVFEGFRLAGDPAMAHVIREWLKENGNKQRRAIGNKVIAELEKRGKTAKPTKPVLAKAPEPPKQRPTLVFEKARAPRKIAIPDVQKQRAQLAELFEAADLTAHMDAIVVQTCVLLPTRVDEKRLELGATKIGGHPDLPAAIPWPRVDRKLTSQPLAFLAQVNLTEAAKHLPEGALPSSGLLSFFVADDPERDYLQTARVVLTHHRDLVRRELPDDYTDRIYQACRVEMRTLLKTPASDDPVLRTLPKDIRGRYARDVAIDCEAAGTFQLLGARDHGYNQSLASDARLLLQCPSDGQPDMQFGDVETLGIFIGKKALAKHDFRTAYPYIGD